MEEGLVSDKQLIEALLRERDELYRRVTKAERRLEELSDTESMRQQYETRIKEMEADHQKLISDMEADFQKEFSKKEDEYKKVISKKEDEYKKVLSKKEDEIRDLVRRMEYMARKLWGRMSEKRQTPAPHGIHGSQAMGQDEREAPDSR